MGGNTYFYGGVNKSKIKQAELSLAQLSRGNKFQPIEFEVRPHLKMVEAEKLVKVTEQESGF